MSPGPDDGSPTPFFCSIAPANRSVTAEEFLRSLLASGVFVAVLPTGAWLLTAGRIVLPSGRPGWWWALAAPAGIGAWSLPLLILAHLGAFDATAIGAAAWIVTAILSPTVAAGFSRWRVSPRRVLPVAALLGLGWLYAAFPNESWLANRDEGLYTLMAVWLRRTGALDVPMLEAAALAGELSRPISLGALGTFYLPGIYHELGQLQLQFPPLLPVWLAQFAAATAGKGLFSANAVFALLTLIVFYALARRFLLRPFALLATVLLALNPASVWIARINLAEPLARLLVLAGLLAAVMAFDRRSVRLAVAAGALLALAAFCRLDLLLLAPLAIVVSLFISKPPPPSGLRHPADALAAAIVTAQVLAVAFLAFTSTNYLKANRGAVLVALTATFAAAALRIALPRLTRANPPWPAMPRAAALAFAIGIFGLLAYAAWIRPTLTPFALIERPGHFLHGTRDFRERSLLSLAAYVGWPVIVAAATGATLIALRTARDRVRRSLFLVATVFVAVTVVILANPRISPDHFWAARRFVPLVIPGMLFLAAWALQAVLASCRAPLRRVAVLALTITGAAWLLAAQWSTLWVRENEGLASQLARLDASLGKASTVFVRDFDALGGTLLLAYGRPVVPLRDERARVDEAARGLWSRCSPTTPCQLLHADHRGLMGLKLGESQQVWIERRVIEPTVEPLPRSVRVERSVFFATPVLGLEPRQAMATFGAFRDWNADEAGFYSEELVDGAVGRWTRGDASIRFAVDPSADLLELRLSAPGPGPRRLRLFVDDAAVYDALVQGSTRIALALAPAAADRSWRELRLISDTFNPKAAGLGDDSRDLGVWIQSIRQANARDVRRRLSADSDVRASTVEVRGAPKGLTTSVHQADAATVLALVVSHRGNAVWPGGAEVEAGEVPVTLGAKWRRRGSADVVLEQRFALPFALRPRERIVLAVPLRPTQVPVGSTLVAGDYDVEFDLVQDGVTWFSARGGVPDRVAVRVVDRYGVAR